MESSTSGWALLLTPPESPSLSLIPRNNAGAIHLGFSFLEAKPKRRSFRKVTDLGSTQQKRKGKTRAGEGSGARVHGLCRKSESEVTREKRSFATGQWGEGKKKCHALLPTNHCQPAAWFGKCPTQSSFPPQKRGQLWAVSPLIALGWVLTCFLPVVMLLPKLNLCSLPENIFNHF